MQSETRKRYEREDRERSDSGSPHFSGVGFAKKERCVLSCGKEIARRVFYHIVCQVGYCIAHCNGAYAEDYRWLLHKNQLNMKEIHRVGDIFVGDGPGNQKTCRIHREIPKKIEPLVADDAIL
jgi:hypothetical protein